ncbi:ATPase [candidate division MSBL1 archaeon SCGC-AAA385D11]|uniref:ATPase n=1 Tax=candidate division MSBL1 archaeon SCGC-AAA385D11 TaxID=1698286 RepID=A0A133VNR5_9EURY|nr:ATPase [candidate division MSBL1 archaeon SCGC-AAA385D11]
MSEKSEKIISDPWSKPADEVLDYYQVSKNEGLNEEEAKQRQLKYGLNKLRKVKEKSRWAILANQFKSLLIALMAIASVLSFIFGKWLEGISISAVLIINAIIGFVTETRAVRSMEALQEMTKIDAKVRRRGEIEKITAEKIIPGDIVALESGDIVPADLRIIEASKLQADESALTGESMPVSKKTEPLEAEVPLAERKNMLYKGTYVTRGTAEAVVVSTGMDTELGKISESIEEAEEEKTPLEKRLDKLAQKLIPLLFAIASIVAIAGIIRGMDIFLMIETSIALAVATVPEGLPIVATLALARGMWRMAQQNALVNRLSSVETLGSTNIICTDKTGTLTENRMTVHKYSMDTSEVNVSGTGLNTQGGFLKNGETVDVTGDEVLRRSLEVGVLCNNASYERGDEEKTIVGDPMEVSLLVAGLKAKIDRDKLLKSMPEVREVSFDPAVKMMATYHRVDDSYTVAVKGAPEEVIEACTHILTNREGKELPEEEKKKWLEKNNQMAENGFRVLALAVKEVENPEADPYKDLTFLGLVGMIDPPRQEVKPAIKTCQKAGIRIIMVTGDHAATARNVAYSVGLIDSENAEVVQGSELKDHKELSEKEKERFIKAPIFARVNPENKLDLIEIHQADGSIVAMTGDGVNDAPALKKADIGVAMGQRGTQVAREAADMVLQDDNFSTTTKAVEQGRIIFRNIRKFIVYLFSCNISELLVIFLASLIGFTLPLLPLQILFLNVVNDIFPAFALGAGEGSGGIMDLPPRDPDEPVLTREHWTGIGAYGILISIAALGAFILSSIWFGMFINGAPNYRVVTISFLTLAFAQLWHVFNMRDIGSNFLKNEITINRYIWVALIICTILLFAATYLPVLSTVLKTVNPGVNGWLLIIGMSLVPWGIGQIWKEIK